MEEKQLKRFLAGLCIAGLLGGVTVTAQQSQSGWSGSKPGAGSTPSGWSGTKPGAVSTPSGESETKPDAGTTQTEEKKPEQKPEEKPEAKPGQSGWSGTKK